MPRKSLDVRASIGSVNARRYFRSAPGAVICTQVDPQGLETLIEFDEEGRYDTADPGIIAVLELVCEEVPAPKKKKDADE